MADASTLMLFVRLIFSLGIVIGLMWIAANVIRKRGLTPAGGRRPGPGVQIEMLARRPMGRNASIAVIRVGERSIVVGVTDQRITKLDDADIDEIELNDPGATWTAPEGPGNGPTSAWKAMLDQMRNRTVRR